ncbi:MAG: FimV/HubP family polar landmark protein, partial [Gammaproteobacteria bacterium]
DFEYEGEEDLLDVTTAASADIDSGDLMEPKISDDETGLDSSELDASEDVDGLDMNIPELEMEAGDDSDDGSLDMESTVQMPPAKLDSLSMADDDEDDDDDKTFLVPKSSNVDEQTEDEEMASQLDLAKAYIELGDNENAKTILDEIISQGSEVYRKQAEELIGQIK